MFSDRKLLRRLIGASLAWLFLDLVYYGNTISSSSILKVVAPKDSLLGQTALTLAIFAVAALPGYFLAAWTIDRIGRKFIQVFGFAMMAMAFFVLWAVPGATTTVGPFVVLFGATYLIGGFIGTYLLAAMLPKPGLADTSLLVAGIAVLGAIVSWATLPEPKGKSLEELTEGENIPPSAVALGLAESRGLRPPAA